MKNIIKRDGRVVPFDMVKIQEAIKKAFEATGKPYFHPTVMCTSLVIAKLEELYQTPTVEQIQDTVEKVLIDAGYMDVAKNYIIYRADRSKARELNNDLMKIYHKLTFQDAKENDMKRENGNIDANTAMGTMLKYGSEGAKHFYHLAMLKPEHSQGHLNGDFHIHDLDFYALTTTCTQINLDNLFIGGFATGHGFLREPAEIRSYAALAAIAIQANQNDQHGGQSIPAFDYYLAPGVAKTFVKQIVKILKVKNSGASNNIRNLNGVLKDYLKIYKLILNEEGKKFTEKVIRSYFPKENIVEVINLAEQFTEEETHQAMEAFVHNLNSMHSRAGSQVPFSSINFGTDISTEGRMVIKNVLLATEEGLGHGETAIFPISIFKVKEGINYNPEDPNYDLFKLACRVSAKRLFPNFSFIDASYNLKYYKSDHPETEIAYMGCRTRVIGNVYDPSREIIDGRGNLSFTTINLPRLAIYAEGNIDKFYKLLDDKLQLVIEQLYERYKVQGSRKVKNSPFLMGQGVWIDSDKLNNEDTLEEVLKHGTLSIGFIGLAECLKSIIGKHHGESEDAQQLGLEIITYMRKRCDEEAEKTKMNYTLLATPAEGLSGRFVKIDKEKFGVIPGVTDREYYTNSFHVPVYYETSAFHKIKVEAPYHELTNAGHISYVELDGDPCKNLDAFEKIIRCMHDSGIGYGSINHPVDRDTICGYTVVIDNVCPKCNREEGNIPFERIRRITGYLVGTVERFNNAKRAEEHDRVKHKI